MDRHELRQILDGCQPAHDGLHPEASEQLAGDGPLRAWYANVQRRDQQISAALLQVPVPENLAERILSRLPSSSPTDKSPAESDDVAPSAAAPVVRSRPDVSPPSRRRMQRRRWLSVAALTAVAAILLLALALWPPSGSQAITPQQVVQWAQHWQPDPQDWQEVSEPPSPYRLSRFTRLAARGWQQFPTQLDPQTVVYDLTQRRPAYMFVSHLPDRLPGFAAQPPVEPIATTGGWLISTWQERTTVYTLRVQGTRSDYHDIVRAAPTALARITVPVPPLDG